MQQTSKYLPMQAEPGSVNFRKHNYKLCLSRCEVPNCHRVLSNFEMQLVACMTIVLHDTDSYFHA
jgi:hypothetical protein